MCRVKQIGQLFQDSNFDNPQRGRIYDPNGIAPALNTCSGGGLQPKIIVKNATKEGGVEIKPGKEIRVRKLTPRECFRLQGFPDEYFDRAQAVNSDSQLYKQAGNSVTVDVIYDIAKRLSK